MDPSSASASVTNHTPFFLCTLVLSSTIQLAILSANARRPFGKYYSFLALNIGVLKSMGRIWSIAEVSMTRLRAVALEVETTFMGLPREYLSNLPLVPALP
ncbi:Transcription factor [Penicillium capsulatum]|uniref:Transcription factor n=1 Tax=Penicillium capsulatum TaxID=69766 RepID=A0A9W9LWM4_9EURO|nr:Transcription factor [Penicillium capsulatum]